MNMIQYVYRTTKLVFLSKFIYLFTYFGVTVCTLLRESENL